MSGTVAGHDGESMPVEVIHYSLPARVDFIMLQCNMLLLQCNMIALPILILPCCRGMVKAGPLIGYPLSREKVSHGLRRGRWIAGRQAAV